MDRTNHARARVPSHIMLPGTARRAGEPRSGTGGGLLAGLNTEQRVVVTHGDGPMLVVAGAGTGKTMTITKRIAWLVLERAVPTDGILALTFTDRAANEVEERVDRELPYGYVDLWVSTFHSFCETLLQRHALDIGLPHDFTLLNTTSAWMLMREHLDRFALEYYRPRGNPTKFLHALLQHIARCKDEAITPAEYLAYAKRQQLDRDAERTDRNSESTRMEELAHAYHTYQQLLLERGHLDFGDLLLWTLELLRTRPAILQRYREQFRYVLVDEFQDTNWTQYEIVRLLAAPSNNLTVVGDDDQSIYAFRGASMSNILQFKEHYPAAAEVAMTTNYRSGQSILDAAYTGIQHNNPNRLETTLALSKRLQAARPEAGAVTVLHAHDASEEARMIVAELTRLHDPASRREQSHAVSWNDFAILVRANSHADQFIPHLDTAGIPYQCLASTGLYRKPIILDLLAYCKLLDDHHESTAMYRVLCMPFANLTHEELLLCTGWAQRKGTSLFTACRTAQTIPGMAPATVAHIEHVLSLIQQHATLARTKRVTEVLRSFLEDSGMLALLTREESAADHEAVSYLNTFWKRLELFEASSDAPSVRNFIAHVMLEREAGDRGALPIDPNVGPEAVRVLTVHAAKGLEFRYVFVTNLVELRFPATDRAEPIPVPDALTKERVPMGDAHMEEERRLFYVAMTRAKDALYLTFADDYGGARKRKPSRFLAETAIPDSQRSEVRQSATHPRVQLHGGNHVQAAPSAAAAVTHAVPQKLSFTQIRAYETCPWQYHYAHVLRIPLRGRYVLSFGQTMHATLQQFFNVMLERRASTQRNLFGTAPSAPSECIAPVPTVDDLLTMFERAWIDDWYTSVSQQQEYRTNGARILREFYAKHTREGWPIVRATEQAFVVKFDSISVIGKADRVDDHGDGVEIIDYKTGAPKDRLTPDDKTQLLIYQVAATQALGVQPTMLSYYYLERNEKVSFLGSPKELVALAERISRVSASIGVGNFDPTPGRHCATCDFRDICPASAA